MKFRLIGYSTLVSLLLLSTLGFLVYFIVRVILESASLKSILNDFRWTESNVNWLNFSKDEGVLMVSEYSLASFSGPFDHLQLEYSSQTWLNNFVFDRSVNIENIYISADKSKVLGEYTVENDLVDMTQDKVTLANPAVLRYIQELEKATTSDLSVYLLARLFQDRTANMRRLLRNYASQKILLNKKFNLTDLENVLNSHFEYNSVNFVKLFLDDQFGLFNDAGLFFWLQILDYYEAKETEKYNFHRTKLESFLNKYNTVSTHELVDYVLFGTPATPATDNPLNLKVLFDEVITDYQSKIKGLCGNDPCSDLELNLLQWGSNIFNKFLSNTPVEPKFESLEGNRLLPRFLLIIIRSIWK